MSITVIRTVHCDKCGKWTDSGLDVATGAEVRRIAKRYGWKVGLPGGQDLCPDCIAMETCTCGPHRDFFGVVSHAPECPSQATVVAGGGADTTRDGAR
jgi:hypothetical protein